MKVELLDSMGNDDTVATAARVSFQKRASEFSEEKNHRLIKYLAEHGHWTPFGSVQLQFRIKIPIFIARQWFRSNVGLIRNETSRRYVSDLPEFWYPNYWRYRPTNIKQGSTDEEVSELWDGGDPFQVYEVALKECENAYHEMIHSGIAPEQARAVLPQAMYTEFIETGSLYAYARICNERLQPDAQREIQEVAQQVSEYCQQIAPVSWRYLNGL